MLCPPTTSFINPQLWICRGYQRPTPKLPSPEKSWMFSTQKIEKPATQGQGTPQNHNMIINAAHTAVRGPASAPPLATALEFFLQYGRRVMEDERHRLPRALHRLQSFPGHLDADRRHHRVALTAESAAFHGRKFRSGVSFSRSTLASC